MKHEAGEPDVVISDVVLRDGLQIIRERVPLEGKKAIFDLLVDSGVRNLEVTSMVPPGIVPQFADAAGMIAHARKYDVSLATVLVPNLKGAELAIAAGADSLVLPLSVSETHSRKNIRKSRRDQLHELRRIRGLIERQASSRYPRLAAGISTAFGCSYEGRIEEDEVFEVVDQCLAAGADEIGLADTVGYATPKQVSSAFRRLARHVSKDMPVRAHFHDTYGMGLANVYAALDAGVRLFDGSLCGLGGCPFAPNATGNVALEDLVFLMQKLGLRTGIDLDRLLHGRQLIQRLLPGADLHGVLHQAGKYPTDFLPEAVVTARNHTGECHEPAQRRQDKDEAN